MLLKTIKTSILEIAYYEHGAETGWPVVLSHGFPYDIHVFDEIAPQLALKGARVIVPYLRGFGPTRFLSPATTRSGQQAALGSDLLSLLDALDIKKAILAGFDWGGVASCVTTILWPERVAGLVSYAGYDVINRSKQLQPSAPALECTMWYQHLFQSERGRACLAQHRRDLCRLLWQQWSPTWPWNEEVFTRTALAFENPDFVDVVIHAYRHVLGTEEGDASLKALEKRLASRPYITVPSITLDGSCDPLKPGGSSLDDSMFVEAHERRVFNVGHAFPMEAPAAFTDAILDVHQWRLSA